MQGEKVLFVHRGYQVPRRAEPMQKLRCVRKGHSPSHTDQAHCSRKMMMRAPQLLEVAHSQRRCQSRKGHVQVIPEADVDGSAATLQASFASVLA